MSEEAVPLESSYLLHFKAFEAYFSGQKNRPYRSKPMGI
jgi:hypothetical protein